MSIQFWWPCPTLGISCTTMPGNRWRPRKLLCTIRTCITCLVDRPMVPCQFLLHLHTQQHQLNNSSSRSSQLPALILSNNSIALLPTMGVPCPVTQFQSRPITNLPLLIEHHYRPPRQKLHQDTSPRVCLQEVAIASRHPMCSTWLYPPSSLHQHKSHTQVCTHKLYFDK